MIKKQSIMKVSSLNELRLLKRNLKKELHYSEKAIESDLSAIVTGYKEWITYNIIEKLITVSASLLLKRLFPKKSK